MYTLVKSAIATCVFLTTVSTSLSVEADTFVFSSKGADGMMFGANGSLSMQISAFENTTQSNSNKTNLPGADFNGSNYTGSACWSGYGSTDTIEFKVLGPLPNRVIASGVILVTWSDYCNYPYTSFEEKVSFTMDLSAIGNQAYENRGMTYFEYGNINKMNRHYDDSSAPAVASASSISSPAFGTVTPNFSIVGQSKGHNVQIIR